MSRIRYRIIIFITALCLIFMYFNIIRNDDTLLSYNQKFLRQLEKIRRRQDRRKELINSMCNLVPDSNSNITTTIGNTTLKKAMNYTSTTVNETNPKLSQLLSIHAHLDHLIVDDYYKIIYCYVPKIASTNWKRVLLFLNYGSSHPNSPPFNPHSFTGNASHARNAFKTLDQIKDLNGINYRLQNYLKFMFVRNPFERILSAFRNKFESVYNNYFQKRFGRKIVRKYRANSTREALKSGNDVQFNEFLQYLSELSTSEYKSGFNEHWRPIEDLCFPCHINYDVIGKYETLEEDALLVLWKTGFYEKMRFPKRNETYHSIPTSSLLRNYYKSVPEKLLRKLLNLYSRDLQLFEYELNLKD